ncbi:MAG: sigma-54-dependent Fis family transcriptional regulator [Desulfobacterales bacterium]|nr:sigma-54-dependent Fis family transcriptional regulator [Desulfobacterales bacterium]
MRILIVDDEKTALTSVRLILRRHGLNAVEICDNGGDAISLIKEKDFDVVLLDLIMPEVGGLQVLEATKPFKPYTEFIVLTAVDDISTVVKAVRLGAYDYLVKPVDNEFLFLAIERAYEHKGLLAGLAGARSAGPETGVPDAFSDIITRDPRMKDLLSYAQIMAASENPILVTGESGTGKELLAQGIHRASSRKNGPFVAVNVSSIPETLFESQFFGHAKGAFTGATTDHAGYFEQANGGTLFLDEIAEIPVNLQVKLLRVLEEKTVVRLGESKQIPAYVRIVSATNADLEKACLEGRFRLDLLYRLKWAHVHLPPLREREADIPLIASHVLEKACARYKKDVRGFSPEAMDVLTHKDFPGNIRQLSQLVENAVLLADSTQILPHHLGEESAPVSSLSRTLCSLKEDVEMHMAYVLKHTNGDRKQAARILGVSVRHVQRKLAQMKKNPRWKALL